MSKEQMSLTDRLAAELWENSTPEEIDAFLSRLQSYFHESAQPAVICADAPRYNFTDVVIAVIKSLQDNIAAVTISEKAAGSSRKSAPTSVRLELMKMEEKP
jgi:hypothetical protein